MDSGLIFDLAVLAILLGFAVFGCIRGFSKMTVGFVSVIGALLLAWLLHPIVAGWFTDWGLEDFFKRTISANVDIDSLATQLENSELIAGTGIKLPKVILDWLAANNTPEAFAAAGVATLSEFLVVFFARTIVKGLAFLAVFVVVAIVLAIVMALFKKLNKIPVFGLLDRGLGLALGLIIGAVVVWGIMLLLMFIGLSGKVPEFADALERSAIGSWMYNHNILISLINSIQGK